MLDIASYTSIGGQRGNHDAFCFKEMGGALMLAMCDGEMDAFAAKRCAQSIGENLLSGNTPRTAVCETMDAVVDKVSRTITVPVCAVHIQGDLLQWANVGNVRLYHFSGGQIGQVSVDDTAAFKAWLSNETDFAGIRVNPARSVLTAPPQENSVFAPHAGQATLADGDAILVCTDGFWQYVFETEMEIDLLKAEDAGHWLDQMLIRLTSRSHMENNHLIACAIRYLIID